jgi:hypothetical protein
MESPLEMTRCFTFQQAVANDTKERSEMVRAKMVVTEKLDRWQTWNGGQKQSVVKLSAVTGEANKTWAKYTPSGSIELSIDNPEAVDAFKLGESYFVDFSIAPAKEVDEITKAIAT